MNCVDLGTGAVLHFPAGSYYEQMSTVWRAKELELMRVTWRASKIAYYRMNDPDRVTNDDMGFVDWALAEDKDEHVN